MKIPCLPILASAAAFVTCVGAVAQIHCAADAGETSQFEAERSNVAAPAPPRERLAAIVKTALERSHAVGARELLAEAASSDLAQARAALDPTIGLEARLGPSGRRESGVTVNNTVQAEGSIGLRQLIYDAGRTQRLIDWRQQLVEAARHGRVSEEAQVAVKAVGLAIEHSRLRQHVSIHGQYARRMACLVRALEPVAAQSTVRASELVQAQKSLQQTQLVQVRSHADMRVVERRLQELLGHAPPSTEGMSAVVLTVPDREQTLAYASGHPELKRLAAQALAAERHARSIEASTWPQVHFTASGSGEHSLGEGAGGKVRNKAASAGLTIRIPVTTRAMTHAAEAAQLRARAALLAHDELHENHRALIFDLHQQALTTADRARRISVLLRHSEQLSELTLQQWRQRQGRSLFDVMVTQTEHFALRVDYVDALHEGQQLNVLLLSLGKGLQEWLTR